MTRRRYGAYAVETSREDKVLFPGDGITKGALIDYYEKLAATMLPFLESRPLALKRHPDGISQQGFFQKQAADHFPAWIDTQRVSKRGGGQQDLVVCRNAATLVYLADQGTISLHPWLSRRDRLDSPDLLVIDIDPPSNAFAPARDAALRVKEAVERVELVPFVKSTGSRGVHVAAPLDRSADFDEVRAVAGAICERLVAEQGDRLTTEQRKARRGRRVLLDISRNAYAQTIVAPYSVRARRGAPVSAPLEWNEIRDHSHSARSLTLRNVARRLGQREDPWKGLFRHRRALSRAQAALEDWPFDPQTT